MVTPEFKSKVINKLTELEKLSGLSSARFAVKIGINQAQWSRLKKGELDSVLADTKFITLARENGVEIGTKMEWKTVETATFQYISTLLTTCQSQQISILLVDYADLGKSHTAKHYARSNRDAFYVDCSQVKQKQLFIRELARQVGVNNTGKYSEVYRDMVFFLNTLENPIIILDEAGDLNYEAFLELKALWNATEGNVAWFMMGADGLKSKITRSINCKKVGYTEIFRRYGSNYRNVTPRGRENYIEFTKEQAALVAKANAPEGTDIQKLLHSCRIEPDRQTDGKKRDKRDNMIEGYSLTNLYNIIRVMNQKKQANG